VLSDALGQLLVIALPEEAFYRGYLQTSLERELNKSISILGARVGLGLVLTSAIFAVGHLLTELSPARLAVFFPSLVFGFLRARSGGIGASLLFHAMCNLFSAYLLRSYGLMH
jgi:membrane protease YdiL (CAAX protease family)